LPFNFAVDYAIKRVQANQEGLKLNGTHQFLFYSDDVNTLGGSVCTIKENTEALVVPSKENGARGGVVVKALCYKPAVRGFERSLR
jgi:hypothetical protein